MRRTTQHIILFIVFIFSFSCCFAQPGVLLRATINRDKIMIGEAIELKLEAKVPVGTDANWFPLDSMAHFEFIDKGKIDTSATEDYKIYRQTILITSFDSGRWSVPSLPLSIGNKDYLTDSLPVSVAYSNFDPKQDYHDIKEIIEVESANTKYINLIILAVALLSLGAVIYFLRKKVMAKQAEVPKKPVSKLSPLQEALQSLKELEQRGFAENIKGFHTELNDVLRQYLNRKANLATKEKTSGELMLQLKKFNLVQDDFTALAQVLRMNDAVKFAKYQPAAAENTQAVEIIRKSIEQLDNIISKPTNT